MLRDSAILLVGALVITLGACTDETSSPPDEASEEASALHNAGEETFGLVQMGHTAHAFAENARAWDGTSTEGRFAYVSAPCSADAPVNNNATNLATFNSRLPGARSPASTRMHPLQFEVNQTRERVGDLSGTLSLTVCQLASGSTPEDDPTSDAEKDRIILDWSATSRRTSEEEIVFDGHFDIQEGTGRYEGITGSGTLHGYFTCAYVPGDCEAAGAFTDVMVLMIGTYEHPDIRGK